MRSDRSSGTINKRAIAGPQNSLQQSCRRRIMDIGNLNGRPFRRRFCDHPLRQTDVLAL